MGTLSDYQRGYRAAQARALHMLATRYDTAEAERELRIEYAMPAPPDPHALTQSQAEIA